MTTKQDIQQSANQSYSFFALDVRKDIEAVNNGNEYALQHLQEGPLSFEKLTTNHRTEGITWEILLSTGGPASRILVTTQEGSVTEADYQFQDWFEPWTSATNQDEDLVKSYAEIVGYYEEG